MQSYLAIVLVSIAVIVAIPIVLFAVEILAALFLPQPAWSPFPVKNRRGSIAVLVPAHNEAAEIQHTLGDITAQLLPGDRVLVVADNCIDDTVATARAAGAEVIERKDPNKIGKGYALDWGMRHLKVNPPAILVILDADCRISTGTLNWLATACESTRGPVQGLYLMRAANNAAVNLRVAEFAFRIKNWMRPLGMRALRLPCQLMGSGMAFPWEIIDRVDLATGEVVEDLKLGLDLARAGHPPMFCALAKINSLFPASTKGAKTQRQRWEQGHIELIRQTVPHFVYQGIAQRNLYLLALALDAAIPPLTLLGMLSSLVVLLSAGSLALGSSCTALLISTVTLTVYAIAIFGSWLKFGRDILPPSATFSILAYIISKISIYHRVFSGGPPLRWIRTDRSKIEKDLR